jgi:hypothetical protein
MLLAPTIFSGSCWGQLCSPLCSSAPAWPVLRLARWRLKRRRLRTNSSRRGEASRNIPGSDSSAGFLKVSGSGSRMDLASKAVQGNPIHGYRRSFYSRRAQGGTGRCASDGVAADRLRRSGRSTAGGEHAAAGNQRRRRRGVSPRDLLGGDRAGVRFHPPGKLPTAAPQNNRPRHKRSWPTCKGNSRPAASNARKAISAATWNNSTTPALTVLHNDLSRRPAKYPMIGGVSFRPKFQSLPGKRLAPGTPRHLPVSPPPLHEVQALLAFHKLSIEALSPDQLPPTTGRVRYSNCSSQSSGLVNSPNPPVVQNASFRYPSCSTNSRYSPTVTGYRAIR